MKAAWVALVALCGCAAAKNIASGNVTASDIQQAKEVGAKGAKVVSKIKSLQEEVKPEQEYYVGRAVATNILARHKYQYRDHAAIMAGKLEGLTAYVNEVGALVAAAAVETHRSGDRPAPIAGWHFVVVESELINAFAAPGGYVFVTTQALKTARNEDELAAILAHEVAHVVRGHALGNIKKSRYADIGAETLQAAGSAALTPDQVRQLNGLLEGVIEDTMDAIFVKGYSRDTEFEADKLAVQIAAAAGYNPGAMVTFLETLQKKQDTGSGGFFQTHPKASDRIARIAGSVDKNAKAPKARTERYLTSIEALR